MLNLVVEEFLQLNLLFLKAYLFLSEIIPGTLTSFHQFLFLNYVLGEKLGQRPTTLYAFLWAISVWLFFRWRSNISDSKFIKLLLAVFFSLAVLWRIFKEGQTWVVRRTSWVISAFPNHALIIEGTSEEALFMHVTHPLLLV